MVRIFSQGSPELDLPRVLAAAEAHFSASIDVLNAEPPPVRSARLRLRSRGGLYSGDIQVDVRAARPADHEDADRAEAAGRAAGMAALARRCQAVLELRPEHAKAAWDDDPALLALCAILASVALGPVLPPDLSTLLGVRSSTERLERALRK